MRNRRFYQQIMDLLICDWSIVSNYVCVYQSFSSKPCLFYFYIIRLQLIMNQPSQSVEGPKEENFAQKDYFFTNESWNSLLYPSKIWVNIFSDEEKEKYLSKFTLSKLTSRSQITINETAYKRDSKITLNDEVKITLFLDSYSRVNARFRNNDFKLEYSQKLQSQSFNPKYVYWNFKGKRVMNTLSSIQNNFGINSFTQFSRHFYRLKIQPQKANVTLYQKNISEKDNFILSTSGSFEIFNNYIEFFSLGLGYNYKNHLIFVKNKYNQTFYKSIWANIGKNLTCQYIYKFNEYCRLGLQGNSGFMSKQTHITGVFQYNNRKDFSIRIQADTANNLGFSIKNSIPNYGSYVFKLNINKFGIENKLSHSLGLNLQF